MHKHMRLGAEELEGEGAGACSNVRKIINIKSSCAKFWQAMKFLSDSPPRTFHIPTHLRQHSLVVGKSLTFGIEFLQGHFVVCHNAHRCVGGNNKVYERSNQDSCEERGANTGGYQTVLC